MKIINVILSGGVGSRLWPLSRKSRPKQYIPIFDKESLFQKTAARNKAFCDKTLIVGNKENYALSKSDMERLQITEYDEIIEACPRNTAAAIAFAALYCHPDDILFVTPSDHLIFNLKSYRKSVDRALILAKEGNLVTFGIKPSKVETGFGYIEFNGENVLSFREKPDYETAANFIESGNFLWNSGMFCFKASVFLEELKKYNLEVFQNSLLAFKKMEGNFLGEKESMEIPSISVDYAVMEKTSKIKVINSDFGWSDMGSFEAIYDYLIENGHPIDEGGNMVVGTEIHSEFVGLKDTILVYTPDALLLLQKENAQQVKKVFEKLEMEKPELTN
jgi:mannose-1-phosphate guanylyltransferase